MTTVLITGANRGIGLEFVRQYAEDGARVFACCRAPDEARELGAYAAENTERVSVHRLDVTDGASIEHLKSELGATPIDILLNNAGVMPKPQGFDTMDYEAWMRGFAVNTIAPFRMTQALIDNVRRSDLKTVAMITSLMGSIADASGGSYAYRSTKTALNMVAHCLANDFREEGVKIALLHPGWVKTDMGGPNAKITVEESVSGLRRVIAELTPKQSGRFLNYDGRSLEW